MEAGQECPICCEEISASERDFYPCICGFQVCIWCVNEIRIIADSNVCPSCREPYDTSSYESNKKKWLEIRGTCPSKPSSWTHTRDLDLTPTKQSLKPGSETLLNCILLVGWIDVMDTEYLHGDDALGKHGSILEMKTLVLKSGYQSTGDGLRSIPANSGIIWVTYQSVTQAKRCLMYYSRKGEDGPRDPPIYSVYASPALRSYCTIAIHGKYCKTVGCPYLHSQYFPPPGSNHGAISKRSRFQKELKNFADDGLSAADQSTLCTILAEQAGMKRDEGILSRPVHKKTVAKGSSPITIPGSNDISTTGGSTKSVDNPWGAAPARSHIESPFNEAPVSHPVPATAPVTTRHVDKTYDAKPVLPPVDILAKTLTAKRTAAKKAAEVEPETKPLTRIRVPKPSPVPPSAPSPTPTPAATKDVASNSGAPSISSTGSVNAKSKVPQPTPSTTHPVTSVTSVAPVAPVAQEVNHMQAQNQRQQQHMPQRMVPDMHSQNVPFTGLSHGMNLTDSQRSNISQQHLHAQQQAMMRHQQQQQHIMQQQQAMQQHAMQQAALQQQQQQANPMRGMQQMGSHHSPNPPNMNFFDLHSAQTSMNVLNKHIEEHKNNNKNSNYKSPVLAFMMEIKNKTMQEVQYWTENSVSHIQDQVFNPSKEVQVQNALNSWQVPHPAIGSAGATAMSAGQQLYGLKQELDHIDEYLGYDKDVNRMNNERLMGFPQHEQALRMQTEVMQRTIPYGNVQRPDNREFRRPF